MENHQSSNVLAYVMAIFLAVGFFILGSAVQEEQIKERYVKIHPCYTDQDIENFEKIFKEKCDSTCYH